MAMTHESFLRYRRYFYLKLALVLCVLAIVAYVWDRPLSGANGGTWLGYTLGTVGALLIAWLAWLGVRKRRYGNSIGTLQGWLSAHVYLGLALMVVATLHAAFEFGWNIHTLAYVLMCVVIVSGIYGTVAYARYPELITRNRAGSTRESWLEEIAELNEQALKLADQIGAEVHRVVVRSVERMRIGGSVWQQMFSSARVQREWQGVRQLLDERIHKADADGSAANSMDAQSTVVFMAGQLAGGGAQDAAHIRRLLDILARRQDLAKRLNRDIRMHARMQIWLYFHVPLSVALLAALTAHIVSVFIYW